jgi:hypothetical protein
MPLSSNECRSSEEESCARTSRIEHAQPSARRFAPFAAHARTKLAERGSSGKRRSTTNFERNRAFERASTTCILKTSDSKPRERAKFGTKSTLGAALALTSAMNSEGKSEGKARQRSENSSHHDGAYNPDSKRPLPRDSSDDGRRSELDPSDA